MSIFANLPRSSPRAALTLAERGLPVFPCHWDSKRPLTPHGFKDAVTDLAQVSAWWRRWPRALIGYPTGERSGLDALDFDRKHGDPDEMVSELEHAVDAMFRGPRLRTINGGYHQIFRHDPRVTLGASGFRKGVDWRGEGGYAIAPDGERYHLVADGDVENWPASLLALIVAHQGVSKSAAGLSVIEGGAEILPYRPTTAELVQASMTDGQRHDAMVRIVAIMVNRGFSHDEIMTFAPLFVGAGARDFNEVATAARGAFEKWGHNPAGAPLRITPEDADRLQFTAYDHATLASIPARRWVYAHYLIRSYVSVLGAPGGVGKTALAASVALSVASGKPLLRQAVHERGGVIFANLEDPLEEMQRRLGAAMILHGLTQADIEQRILLLSGRDQSLIVAERTKDGVLIATPIVDRCIREIRERGVILFIVDPFVASHSLEENRNEQVNFAVKQWRRIAHETECSILLSHHFRKGGESGSQDSFRGASALIDAARAAVALAPIQPADRELFGLSEQDARGLIRMDDAKLNLAPRPDQAHWYQLCSMTLPNGDNVQAVKVWDPPSKYKGLTLEVIGKILDELEHGYDRDHPYSPSRQSGERWAGRCITSVASEHEADVSDEQAAAIIREWLSTELLRIAEYEKPNRTPAKGIYVNNAKRPSADVPF